MSGATTLQGLLEGQGGFDESTSFSTCCMDGVDGFADTATASNVAAGQPAPTGEVYYPGDAVCAGSAASAARTDPSAGALASVEDGVCSDEANAIANGNAVCDATLASSSPWMSCCGGGPSGSCTDPPVAQTTLLTTPGSG